MARAALGAAVVLIAALTFAARASAQESFTVDFSYSPEAPIVGESVTFTSTSTSSPQTFIVRESWDFNDDGQFDESGPPAPSVLRTFLAPYSYPVTLEAENDIGEVKSTSKLVTVSPSTTPPPQVPPPPPAPRPPPPPSSPAPLPTPSTGSATRVPAPPMAISPFPVVRITGSYTTLGVRLRLFAVTAPAGVTITVRCRGGGCPYIRSGPFVVRRSGTRRVGTARYVRIRGFGGRLLRPGVRVQVFVAQQGRIGKYTSFRIRRGRAPTRADACLRPGRASVISCG